MWASGQAGRKLPAVAREALEGNARARDRAEDDNLVVFREHKDMPYHVYVQLVRQRQARKAELRRVLRLWGDEQARAEEAAKEAEDAELGQRKENTDDE